jgi:hypothetical protein
MIVGRPKLYQMIERNNGPFFATLQKHCRTHISSVRFVGSGGPKPVEAEIEPATTSHAVPPPPIQDRQYKLEYPPKSAK